MANYHMRMSRGNIGKGVPHVQYILGQGKYDYKDKEVQYVSNNLPSWSKDEVDFWNEGDYNENINGRVYTELTLSLPNSLDLENNIKLLDDFVEQTLGKDHHYTVAIHDKESSHEGIQNIHAHVMFSERKLDDIERGREAYFKRANRANKEKGGCKKDRMWQKKEKLLSLRKDWEILQNNYLVKNNINEKVSCETLKKQREEALKQGDKLKAKLLDREPVAIDGEILMKRKRTPREEKELDQFKLKREIKTLKEETYILELKELEEQMTNVDIKGLENKIINLKEENMNLPFSDILNMKSNIEMYNLEIEKSLNDIKNVRTLAINELYPALSVAELELNIALDNGADLLDIERLENSIDKESMSINEDILQDKIIEIKNGLEERMRTLELQKISEFKSYEELREQITDVDIKEYIEKQVFETNKENYSKYIKEEIKLNKLENRFKKISTLKEKGNIEKTALNILTRNKYSKLENEIDNLLGTRGKLDFKIREKGNYDGIKGDGSKESNDWIRKYEMLFDKIVKKENELKKLNDKLNTPDMKNKKIRIEKSIEKKLDLEKEKNLFEQFKTKNNIEILKDKLSVIQDKKEVIRSNISGIEKENDILNKSIDLNKLKINKNKDNLSDDKIEIEAYIILTDGKTKQINNQYQDLKKENLKMRKELEQVSGFNLLKKQKLANAINKIIKEMKKLENEDLKLKGDIPTEVLYDKIVAIKEIKENEIYEKEGKELENNLKNLEKHLKENKQKIRLNKNLLREDPIKILKPHTPTFKQFKEDNISNGYSSLKIWSNEEENDFEL